MPLFGLIVCGGNSTRMKRDKSLLEYYGKPQRDHLFELLNSFCSKVYVSCNAAQAKEMSALFDVIPDAEAYTNIGPMASLLSAFDLFPEADFLVIGCDYPFVGDVHLGQLVNAQTAECDAVCFRHGGISEPLVAIYTCKTAPKLHAAFKKGKLSLRHFLDEARCVVLEPSSAEFLRSVDDEAGYRDAVERLSRQASG